MRRPGGMAHVPRFAAGRRGLAGFAVASSAAMTLGGCGLSEHARPPFVPEPAELVAPDAPEASAAEPDGRLLAQAALAAPQIRLADLLRAVESASPEIAAAADDVRAATGRAWQAGLHPNPSVEFTREGPLDRRPWGRTQFLAGVRQPIVVSGRRKLAADAELADREVRVLDAEDVRRRVLGEARAAFVELVHLRDAVALHRELIALAQQTLDLARERVQAKVAIDVESLKPELEVQFLQSTLVGLERQFEGARAVLEASLGGLAVAADRLVREPVAPLAKDSLGSLVQRVRETHPAARAARQAVEAARERLALARTESRPDISVGVAVGRDFDGNDFVAEFGVEIPLAVFDEGQGRILEAQALVSKARRAAEAVENQLAVELSRRYGEYDAARARLQEMRDRLLPFAERSLEATREACRNARLEFLDLLDAQRTLLEARAAALALERDMEAAHAEILTLTGDMP